jgi:hypothetical protein
MKWRLDQTHLEDGRRCGRCVARSRLVGLLALALLCPRAWGAESPAATRFRKDVQPLLAKYCYDCHGDGLNKGGIAF